MATATADAAKFWNEIAPKYARDPIKDMVSYEMTLDKTRGHLGPDSQVLEIGAGTGSTAMILAKDCGRITATDISEKMLEVGRERAWNEGIGNITFEVRLA